MRKKVIVGLILSLILILAACNQSSEEENEEASFNDSDFEAIVSSNNNLTFKLLEHVESNEDDNIFISPTSLFIALSMVYNGAEGETKRELAQALQIGSMGKDELNNANASLIAKLMKQSDDVELSIANSIWLNEEFSFQDEFSEASEQFFKAQIDEIDVADNKSADLINKWVNEETKGKIPDIVEAPLSGALVTLLLNAIYFNGKWTYEFDESLTEKKQFTNSNGDTLDLPLMSLEEELLYMDNNVFQAVSLPYGEDEMSMDIYLPRENVTLDELKDELLGGRWEDWNRQFQEEKGTVLLPKFELEYETSLNETLQQLGMKLAFTEDAQFPHMVTEDDPLYISNVRQKTYIDVHEKGTEAAAVTSVEVVTTSLVIEDEPFVMEVNRPFFFIIKDNETNLILFTGLIENPN